MRVIGGDGKGKRIFSPGKDHIRPTSDMVKEALFNILPSMAGKTFLDVFAGAGTVGIEALSRGAAFAVFIEKDRSISRFIEKNILLCGFSGRYEILTLEARKAISVLRKREVTFNFLFADPPYDQALVQESMRYFTKGTLFSKDGLLIIQHSVREELRQGEMDCLILTDQRRYGDTMLSFFKLK